MDAYFGPAQPTSKRRRRDLIKQPRLYLDYRVNNSRPIPCGAFMFQRIFLISLCFAAPALAQSEDCKAVRRTISLAADAWIETSELSRLEAQVCGRPTRAACQQLDEFWMLAVALRQAQSTINAIEAQREVWCARDDEPSRPLQWPDGQTLRSSTGTISWSNGSIARSTTGSWSAPSGTMVRSSTGSLSFPSGSLARSSSGRWMLSTGESADDGRIASLACYKDQSWCRFFMGEMKTGSPLHRDFAQLGLAILASNR